MPGDDMILRLSALAHPLRLKALALLHDNGPIHVSELARMVGISRPLLILHVRKLEAAELVRSEMTLSDDGKAMNMLSVVPFVLELTPEIISGLAPTLTQPKSMKDSS